jgi:hypothetical protein
VALAKSRLRPIPRCLSCRSVTNHKQTSWLCDCTIIQLSGSFRIEQSWVVIHVVFILRMNCRFAVADSNMRMSLYVELTPVKLVILIDIDGLAI